MSGKIPVRIVSASDVGVQPVGIDFGPNHNFEVVTAADQRAGGHVPMTAATAAALGISAGDSLPLDGIAAPYLAVGIWKLRTDYAGDAFRVRDSTTAVTREIPFIGTDFDTSAGTGTGYIGANSGTVALWYDQSGNANDVGNVASPANQPVLITTGAQETLSTGVPCIRFNANTFATKATVANTDIADASSNHTIIAVWQTSTLLGGYGLQWGGAVGVGVIDAFTDSSVYYDSAGSGAGQRISVNNAPTATARVMTFSKSNPNLSVRRNGSSIVTGASGTTSLTVGNATLTIGQSIGVQRIAAVLWWPYKLSDGDIATVESRLLTLAGL